jgi:hypothetical protein
VFPSVPAAGDEGTCLHGTRQTVEAGIVKAVGCFTQATDGNGATVYTAAFDDNGAGVDLNGFVVTGDKGKGLQINTDTRTVRSIAIATGNADSVFLNSRNFPLNGQVNRLGTAPLQLAFIAPLNTSNASVLLEDLHLGSNSVAGALAGLSPVGDVETPVRLESDGSGSMDMTVSLAGIFTLNGHPQSATIALPTASEEGTHYDGVEIKLQEIDFVPAVKLYDLDAHYSVEKKSFGGTASIGFPFFAKGKGVTAGFNVQNGTITDLVAGVHGTKIPIGGAGFLTDIAGGFHIVGVKSADFNGFCKSIGYESAAIVGGDKGPDAFTHWKCHKGSQNDGIDVGKACQWQTGNPNAYARYNDPNDARSWQCVGFGLSGDQEIQANASLGADFGAVVPTPFGNIEPIRVDAGIDLGYVANQFLLRIHGGVSLFRLPVGDVYLAIHSDSGVEFGVGLGIGFPSFKNNENDPFYIGARVDGWVGKGKFQLEGKGRVALFGAKLFDGRILVNDRAAGACWTVVGVAGGAVYQYGSSGVKTFGVGCGLDDYREQFPGGSAATAAHGRTFHLTPDRHTLAIKGARAAPRFTLRSADGRMIHTPTSGRSSMTNDYAVFVNEAAHTTYVVLRHPRGTWTVTPDRGTGAITSLRAARTAPKEHVTASVHGTGRTRTLEFHSLNRPHTRLLFTEQLPDGHEIPILDTDAASGRKRFTVARGFGARRLRVVVIHGFGSRQSGVVARFRVGHARKLDAPANVSAWRDEHTVRVRWSGVNGAQGYLVEVSMRKGRRLLTSFVRRVSARTRSIAIPHHPGTDGGAVAKVYALNVDDALGRTRGRAFPTNPSVTSLSQAARLSARSAVRRGGGVDLRTQCPEATGHCQVRIELLLKGRRVATAGYQQTPDTFRSARVVPGSASARRILRGNGGSLRMVVEMHHLGDRAPTQARFAA